MFFEVSIHLSISAQSLYCMQW